MNRIERLPEVSDHVLSGLTAGEDLKQRILLAASSGYSRPKHSFRTVVALCSLSILLVLLCVFALQSKTPDEMQVIPAGSRHSTPPVVLESILEKTEEISQP